MISISWLRLSTYACSESTRSQTGSNPALRNSRSNSSASCGLSSTSRSLRRCAKLIPPFARLIEQQPVVTQFLHGSDEALKVYRFHDVAVDSQMVPLYNVHMFLGRREHDHSNGTRARITLHQ